MLATPSSPLPALVIRALPLPSRLVPRLDPPLLELPPLASRCTRKEHAKHEVPKRNAQQQLVAETCQHNTTQHACAKHLFHFLQLDCIVLGLLGQPQVRAKTDEELQTFMSDRAHKDPHHGTSGLAQPAPCRGHTAHPPHSAEVWVQLTLKVVRKSLMDPSVCLKGTLVVSCRRHRSAVRRRQRWWSSRQLDQSAVVCAPVFRWQLATIICQLISLGLPWQHRE